MKQFFLFALLFCCTALVAQKKEKLAYYDEDSILKIWPMHQMHQDSMEKYKENVRRQLMYMSETYMRKDSALRADSATLSSEVYAVRKAELENHRNEYEMFVTIAEEELKTIAAKFDSLCSGQMRQAAITAGKKKGYKLVETKNKALQMEAAAPETNYEMADITGFVMTELKIVQPLPKR